ncbi:phosphoenolpyruvate--protein phosphotransferase [Streptomyces sp. DSM 44915]|uniref:Phosphoenolpyruvate-protein phosphotransferase n=1 Tax=Streptomyces chisholmiae TaxID=3075540 RepID=A0ABU2JXD8_9ACTN|nr:phosphoenolpyruvate--protein phosphotransferase [Streptomyces sp. DSM 44915]MDT0269630.1 phosphoenolpyruvate--protein phosphotransferase [Streptomyces sp. DSM 44915]
MSDLRYADGGAAHVGSPAGPAEGDGPDGTGASGDGQRSVALSGVGVSPGHVIGPVARMAPPIAEPDAAPRPGTAEAATEHARFTAARDAVAAELTRRAEAAGDGTAGEVLGALAMMATDPTLDGDVATALADTQDSVERATWLAAGRIADQLAGLGGYLAERAGDVRDVGNRIVAELRGVPAPGLPTPGHPYVLVADDLAPADTATLDPETVLAIVTEGGGQQSHTAILARALGIPAVVAAPAAGQLADGTEVYVNGVHGEVVARPDAGHRDRVAAWSLVSRRLARFSGAATLADGRPVTLLANVGGPEDAAAAARLGARGVGLFRTEFCFLGNTEEPTFDEQLRAYREVLAQFPGGTAVVRTLDAGSDKPLPFVTTGREANPALGVRGFRTAERDPGVLRRQLHALAAAAAGTDTQLKVMAPMVTTVAEAAGFRELCAEAGITTSGVMIEVPAAALDAEALLRTVDFVSIGTNDLTQYTMAADREHGALSAFHDPWQPAVLRLVRHVAEAGGTVRGDDPTGAGVGVCGEAAADPALAVVLVGLGVTSLSMTARALPTVAAVLASVTEAEAARLARACVGAPDAQTARATARDALPVLTELGL